MANRYRPVWAPENIDLETPSTARMYDYYLGLAYILAVRAECINAMRRPAALTMIP